MADTIRVIVVDDIPETREHLAKLLSFETDIEVVAVAASGLEAIEAATRLSPDVVLMDINMPGMDGIATTEELGRTVPTTSVVMMSVQGEADYLRRSMLAGAREFLVKPFSSDELCAAIRGVHAREREKMGRFAAQTPVNSAVPSRSSARPAASSRCSRPRAGSGARRSPSTSRWPWPPTWDARWPSWTPASSSATWACCSNLNPRNKSIVDILGDAEGGNDVIDGALISHSTGIRVLLAPPSPEMAELVTTEHIRRIVDRLRRRTTWSSSTAGRCSRTRPWRCWTCRTWSWAC